MRSAEASRAIGLLADTIARERVRIENTWLTRVQRDVVKTPGVELTHLRDGIPDYLNALVQVLRAGSRERFDLTGRRAWAAVAREHGITRVRIGFDIGQLIREFIVLRQVIRELAVEKGPNRGEQEAALADLLDAAITAAVQAYVDARDYDSRRAQAQSVAFLTHELKNPLSNAVLAAGRLRSRATPEQQRSIDALERALTQLTQLIDRVLLTERLESGAVECRLVESKLGDLMEPALEAARTAALRKGLVLQIDYDAALTIDADPRLLSSAIQNLADNAVKYTDFGEVRVSVERRAGKTVFHVRDTCHGLSPEELQTIFEPFRRGQSSQDGTGLGLAIARRAAEAQGGTIEAESPGPSGCHFWITLPDARPASSRSP